MFYRRFVPLQFVSVTFSRKLGNLRLGIASPLELSAIITSDVCCAIVPTSNIGQGGPHLTEYGWELQVCFVKYPWRLEVVLSFHASLEEIKLKVCQPGGMLNAINLVSVANYNK